MGELYLQMLVKRMEWLSQQCELLLKLSKDFARITGSHAAAVEQLYKLLTQPEKQALRDGHSDYAAWAALGSTKPAQPADDFQQPVLEVQIAVQPDGKGWVTIDGGWPFLLSRKLTCLLLHLVSADHHRVDGLPAFRCVAKLKQTVSEFADSDLGNLIYRLREALAAHYWPRGLLQTDKRRDGCYVRFRVRRFRISGRLPPEWQLDLPPDDFQLSSA